MKLTWNWQNFGFTWLQKYHSINVNGVALRSSSFTVTYEHTGTHYSAWIFIFVCRQYMLNTDFRNSKLVTGSTVYSSVVGICQVLSR